MRIDPLHTFPLRAHAKVIEINECRHMPVESKVNYLFLSSCFWVNAHWPIQIFRLTTHPTVILTTILDRIKRKSKPTAPQSPPQNVEDEATQYFPILH